MTDRPAAVNGARARSGPVRFVRRGAAPRWTTAAAALYYRPMNGVPFVKMHGLGNDFAVVDERGGAPGPDGGRVRALADRRRGIGFDQLVVIGPPLAAGAQASFSIRNADGGPAEACGNAARCVAGLLMDEGGLDRVRLDTDAGPLDAWRAGPGRVRVDMGAPAFDWRRIPLAAEADTARLELSAGPLSAPAAVNMGNPHAVFFVDDAEAVDLEALGPRLERDPVFPERANIGVAAAVGPDRLRVRVWERGAGLTPACGTGACAAAVAAARRGLCGRRVETVLDGGALEIFWRADDRVEMTGPYAYAFRGRLPS